ncbi:MAG: Flp family type IVb pilin [Ruminococcaceae bacterium]|jgi:pilus assembly protein Flp/PilA|nr:Flp family type IVb pilin [Oscillospiraceae bacterium]
MTFLKDENGQGLVEYALILGLISIAAIVVLIALGPKIRNSFDSSNKQLDEVSQSK